MNQKQKNYAMERVDGIAKRKIEAIREAMPVIPPKILNYRKAIKLIKEGKVKLKMDSQRSLGDYAYFTSVFDFSAFHDPNACKYNKKAFNKKANVIRAEQTRVRDQIMLGDSEEALKLIEAFEEM